MPWTEQLITSKIYFSLFWRLEKSKNEATLIASWFMDYVLIWQKRKGILFEVFL